MWTTTGKAVLDCEPRAVRELAQAAASHVRVRLLAGALTLTALGQLVLVAIALSARPILVYAEVMR